MVTQVEHKNKRQIYSKNMMDLLLGFSWHTDNTTIQYNSLHCTEVSILY